MLISSHALRDGQGRARRLGGAGLAEVSPNSNVNDSGAIRENEALKINFVKRKNAPIA
jgi:hypothetical protein